MSDKKIEIFDSTLRDGSQGEGISFSVQDKINIVKALDKFGVDYIEAGNPGSNPKDLIFFEMLKSIRLEHAKLCAFGSTRRNSVLPENDLNIINLVKAETPVCVIFGKTWDLHVHEILKISLDDNLTIVSDTIRYLKSLGKEVIFDAEHFFDGYKAKSEYAISVLLAAIDGGADEICLCDTNGGCMPHEISAITETICGHFPDFKVSIHCHDDTGCAVANSIAAVRAGAVGVQGTFVGYGERCGNADLSTIIPNLALKCGYKCNGDLSELKNTAAFISEISNVHLRGSKPYVGKSAFAHKAGMHIDGVMKLAKSFEHINPELVGNQRKFLTSEVAGRGTILPLIKKYVPTLNKNSPETENIINVLKKMEFDGYQYEAADASFELLIKKQLGLWQPSFKILFFNISDEFTIGDGQIQSRAMIRVEVNGETEVVGDIGNGPVNAIDKALRKVLRMFYPEIENMHLIDYKVRVINSNNSTAARTRVLIESTDGVETWSTIGVSDDIIEASFIALIDSFEYILSRKGA